MSRPQRLRCRIHRSEEGSALVLALVVVVSLGLLLSAALSFAGGGLTSTPKQRELRNQTNYAQGTVDAAINNIRGSSIAGTTAPGQPLCADGDFTNYTPPTPNLASGTNPGADGSTQFRTRWCANDSGNEPFSHVPLFAIQTLGTTGSAGLNTTGNDTLIVDGGVYSANRIVVNGGNNNKPPMQVEGSVFGQACSGPIITTDAAGVQCPGTSPAGADPGYSPAIASAAALADLIDSEGADPTVTCPDSTGRVAWFSPGYYSELPETLLADAAEPSGANCQGDESLWWFQPGFYYFDFSHAADGNDWAVHAVVGGTPYPGSSWTTDGVVNNWRKACDNRTNDDATPVSDGVQFIFGGDSTLTLANDDKMAVCGPSESQDPGSDQSIAIFGLGGDDPNDAAAQGTGSAAPSGTNVVEPASSNPTSTPVTAFLPTSGAKTIGDGSTTTSTAILGGQSVQLDYSGFDIPPGSHITGLRFRVARTVDAGNLQSERLKYALPGGQTWTRANLPSSCNPCEINANVPTGGEGWRLSLQYTARASNGGAAVTMDGIAAIVTYTGPVLEPLTPDHGRFIDAGPTGNPHVTIQIYGTLYAPGVGMGVEAQSSADVIFSRGVILWTLNVSSIPSFTQTDAPFQLPGFSAGRLVQFVGQVSNDSGATWTDVVQACVRYHDNNSSGSPGPQLPGNTLTVDGWTVLRSSSQQAPKCA